MSSLRFRQVHLDFHTSEDIPNVGAGFEASQFQAALRRGGVDSITVFAKCHHGWHYHATTAGVQHPTLAFDLLSAQREAASAIDVRTPVYISAGLDERLAKLHGGWLRRMKDGSVPWAGSLLEAGFHELCMNTPYLDVLVAQAHETTKLHGEHGVFFDIVSPKPCWCSSCVKSLIAAGQDPRNERHVNDLARRVHLAYVERINAAVHDARTGVNIFHNGGHIPRGDAALAAANPNHLELESLPTGGWGYDHFPLSIAYARHLRRADGSPKPCLGMTGKFHKSWGEFGGYKHPNALRYEAAAAIAQGAGVSVGDQLHPSGQMDIATYNLIGVAFHDVKIKEPWVRNARVLAEIAVLSVEGCESDATKKNHLGSLSDEGAVRVILDGHLLFDVVDAHDDWSSYRLLVLPDAVSLNATLAERIRAFVAQGGKVFATGTSLLLDDHLIVDVGCRDAGESAFDPDYIRPLQPLAPWGEASFVVYAKGRNLVATGGTVLAHRNEPYFNRDLLHFCSHLHTPPSGRDGGPVIVQGPAGIICAHPLFATYQEQGTQALRDLALSCIRRLLGSTIITVDMPSAARVFLARQEAEKRDIVHLLYAPIMVRGTIHGKPIQVIEDLVPLHQISLSVARASKPGTVSLQPQGIVLASTWSDGRVNVTIPRVDGHQMVVMAD